MPEDWKPVRHSLSEILGPIYGRREAGAWIYAWRPDERHLNGRGIVHGGLLMTLADHVGGMVAWEAVNRAPMVTVQLNTHFVSGAQTGDLLVGSAQVVRSTRALVFMRGLLQRADQTVLTFDGIWRRLDDRS